MPVFLVLPIICRLLLFVPPYGAVTTSAIYHFLPRAYDSARRSVPLECVTAVSAPDADSSFACTIHCADGFPDYQVQRLGGAGGIAMSF